MACIAGVANRKLDFIVQLNIPIYVISLAREKHRRATITDRLQQADVKFEIVDAVDGKKLDLSTLKNRLNQKKFSEKYNREMYLGEIGCFLSHYDLWQRMVDEQTPYALIIEDDATWDDDFFAVVQACLQSKYYWNIIHLASPEVGRIYSVLQSVGSNRQLARFKHPMGIAAAYLIDLDGAKKLLKQCYEIFEPNDMQWLLYWQSNLYFYHVQPPPATNISGDDDSGIGDRPFEKSKHQLRQEIGRFRYLWQANKKRYARRFYHWTHPPKLRN